MAQTVAKQRRQTRTAPAPVTARRPRARSSDIVRAALLCALALAAYSNSFSTGFTLDSRQLVLNDTRVHAATAENLDLIVNHTYWWPYGESGLYRPLTTFSYLFNYAIVGSADRPPGYHWFNLLLHAANVLLLWSLAFRLSGRAPGALAAAAIWAVHPLGTEAVTNIVGRADLIACLGVLGGLSCYWQSRDSAGASRVMWLSTLAALTLTAVFAKESAVTLLGIIPLVEVVWWDRRRSVPALASGAAAAGLPILLMLAKRHQVLAAVPVSEFPFIDNPIVGADFFEGRFTALSVAGRYLFKMFWPATLSVDYSYNQIPIVGVGAAAAVIAVALVAAIAAAIYVRHRDRAAFFFAACAVVTFLPASNLLFATGTIMAERLVYLPSALLIVAVALTVAGVAVSRQAALGAIAVAVVCVVAGGTRTWLRNRDWQDDVALWTAAVAASPSSSKAHLALAEALSAGDRPHRDLDRIISEAEQSVALIASLADDRSSFQSYRVAAAAHLERAEALRRANARGAALSPDATQSYRRATALLTKGIDVAAASSRRIGADGSARQADARLLLAVAALGLGEVDRATTEASEARRLSPLDGRAHQTLADVYMLAGRTEQAAVALMVGSMMTGDPSFRATLIDLYRRSDPNGCAVSNTGAGVVLNASCGTVRTHLCLATDEAVAFSLQVGRREQAEQLRKTANEQLRCGAR